MSVKYIGEFFDVMNREGNEEIKTYFDRIAHKQINRYYNKPVAVCANKHKRLEKITSSDNGKIRKNLLWENGTVYNEDHYESYNDLIFYFQDQGILKRFDPYKILKKQAMNRAIKEGATKEEALLTAKEKVLNCEDVESALKDYGCDMDTKWKQFIGMYVRKRINESGSAQYKESTNFIHDEELFDYGNRNATSWMQSQFEIDEYTKKVSSNKTGEIKVCPSRKELDYSLSTKIDNHEDIYSACELEQEIYRRIGSNQIVKDVYECIVKQGHNIKSTMKELDLPRNKVSDCLNKIRSITKSIISR